MSIEDLSDDAAVPSALPKDFQDSLRQFMKQEFDHFLQDVEWRVKQAYDVERRTAGERSGIVHTEDLDILMHQMTGYTMTANSPSAGSIAWTAVHIVFAGVDYTIADGSTALKYTWFVKPGSGSAATLQSSNTKPTLGPNDCLVFVNYAGTPVNALTSTIPVTVADGAVDSGAIANGAVTAAKTDFYTSLTTAITNAQTAADNARAIADGEISTYFQGAAPWANGSTQDDAKTGDMWMDDDGQAYRWTGAAGTPANTWKVITDNALSKALADAQAANNLAGSKNTVFYRNFANTPTAVAVGDTWVVLDQDMRTRYATAPGAANWVDAPLGTAGLANNAVTNAKIASGVDGAKLSSGTVGNTQLGSGLDGAKLSTGTVGSTQLSAGSVTPTKFNTLQHIMF